MAIALIISPSLKVWFTILTDTQNSQTIAANLALNFPESNPLQREALIGTGLMLFVISLAVNFAARGILARTGRGATKRKLRRAGVVLVPDASPIVVAETALSATEPGSPADHAAREALS